MSTFQEIVVEGEPMSFRCKKKQCQCTTAKQVVTSEHINESEGKYFLVRNYGFLCNRCGSEMDRIPTKNRRQNPTGVEL